MLIVLILASMLLTAIVIARRSAALAVVSVYLPVLLLWPFGYGIRIKGVEIDFLMAVALPIALTALWRYAWERQLTILDAIVFLYPFSDCISEWRANGQSSGMVALVAGMWTVLPSYLIGRVLIESLGMRLPFLRRFTSLLAIVSVLSFYEFRMESNPFRRLAGSLTGSQTGWSLQIRWGHGRISGPYGHAILAGVLLICGLLFSIWLYYEGKTERVDPKRPKSAWNIAAVPCLATLAGIAMTQSRGPWMGGIFGILLLYVGRAKNVKRSLARTVLFCAGLFLVFAFATARYTDEQQATHTTQDQENAMYRRELITNYVPVIENGGLLGWGMFFPHVDGQGSIDNEYLRVGIQQGYLGVILLLAMIGRAGYLLLRFNLLSGNPADIRFGFCLLGTLTSVALTLTTVYLGAQVFTVFFLFLGWAQALKPSYVAATEDYAAGQQYTSLSPFAFRRVFS